MPVSDINWRVTLKPEKIAFRIRRSEVSSPSRTELCLLWRQRCLLQSNFLLLRCRCRFRVHSLPGPPEICRIVTFGKRRVILGKLRVECLSRRESETMNSYIDSQFPRYRLLLFRDGQRFGKAGLHLIQCLRDLVG